MPHQEMSHRFGKQNADAFKAKAHFPEFPGEACQYNHKVWEINWEQMTMRQQAIGCDDYTMAVLTKLTAKKNSSLETCLHELSALDGTLAAAGYKGVQIMIKEDFAPKGADLIVESREYVLHGLYRKYKERPRWFFKRVDVALVQA